MWVWKFIHAKPDPRTKGRGLLAIAIAPDEETARDLLLQYAPEASLLKHLLASADVEKFPIDAASAVGWAEF